MTEQTQVQKLTVAQTAFFTQFAEDAVRESFTHASDDEAVEKFVSGLDLKEFGTRLGKVILSRVSYSDVKAVDKFLKSDQYNNVIAAVAEAVEVCEPTQNDAQNLLLASTFVLETMSPLVDPQAYADAQAVDAQNDPQLTFLDRLQIKAQG